MADSVAKSSLASQCAAYIEKNNISLNVSWFEKNSFCLL
jgi:hypothetical protein